MQTSQSYETFLPITWMKRRGGEHASKLSCLGERSEQHENVRASGEAARKKARALSLNLLQPKSQPVLKPTFPGLPSLTGLLSRAFRVQRSRPVRKSTVLSCCEGLRTSYFFPRWRPRSRQAKFKMEDFLKHSKVLWCSVLFCFVSIFLNRIHKLCFELFLQVNNYLQVSK